MPRTSDLEPGTLINGIYRLVRLMGVGGMGEVWEARHERTKGRVALKLLLPEMGRHHDVLQRFQREVEITSGLNHPNIVRVSDADKLPDGRPFLVMEFLEGYDLSQATGQPMPFGKVAEIVEQTAMGLHAAHGQSIVHRDLKPANIFLVPLPGTSRALIKILDFGISKALDGLSRLTHTHSVIGTPYYMAPEQARGGISSMDGRADQFSLAAIAYELLTGRMAFEGDGTLNVLYKVVLETPPTFEALGITAPAGVEAVVMRGMSKNANDRFASVLEFSDALKKAGGALQADANAVGWGAVAPAPRAVATPGGSATPAGFPPAGGTLKPDTPVVSGGMPTPRTLRLPDDPGQTTLRGSTGEVARPAGLQGEERRAADVAPRRSKATSKAKTIGLVAGGGAIAAVIVAVALSRGAPSTTPPTVVEGAPVAPAIPPPAPPPPTSPPAVSASAPAPVAAAPPVKSSPPAPEPREVEAAPVEDPPALPVATDKKVKPAKKVSPPTARAPARDNEVTTPSAGKATRHPSPSPGPVNNDL